MLAAAWATGEVAVYDASSTACLADFVHGLRQEPAATTEPPSHRAVTGNGQAGEEQRVRIGFLAAQWPS